MPTYEYKCSECEERMSEIRSIHAPTPEHLCIKCGQKMNQVISLGGVTFNGSGFYSTDKKK
jgi:putative FmdB family regulatory protein